MNNNYFTDVPQSVMDLRNLENLDISNNRIQTLSENFWSLDKLKLISLGANPWSGATLTSILEKANVLRQRNTIVNLNSEMDESEEN